MEWLYFLGGMLTALAGAGLYLRTYGKRTIHIPPVTPKSVTSVAQLQPVMKSLMASGADRDELFVRSASPRFLVRVRKRQYKSQPNVLILEIRHSDENKAHYSEVKAALAAEGIAFKERRTPKRDQPKNLQVRLEVGTYTPSAVANVLRTVFDAAGSASDSGLQFSDRDPVMWNSSTLSLDGAV